MYTDIDFQKALRLTIEEKPKRAVIYCRVSSPNQEELSPQQEIVEDFMSIIHTFSRRLYSLRKYKKAKDLISNETSAQDTNISK